MSQLSFVNSLTAGAQNLIVIGLKPLLESTNKALWSVLSSLQVDSKVCEPVIKGSTESVTVWSTEGKSITFAQLSDERGRNTGVLRGDLLSELIGKLTPKEGDFHAVLALKDESQCFTAAASLARAFPLYNKKTSANNVKAAERKISVSFALQSKVLADVEVKELQLLSNAVQFCQRLVDMPTSELHSDSYLDEIKRVVKTLSSSSGTAVQLTTIYGEELDRQGFGGLWGVGKAAEHPPVLAVLSHSPAGASKTHVMVGKGIMFDTGGLSIKDRTNMCTMKADMGGSAAILAAFEAAVKGGYKENLHAVLCIAENSVDSRSTRPDDILYMHSGKTVEINNTDAEGRLVLADGVSYASKNLRPDLILDMATLTGAQGVCTGQKHAAILANDADLERAAFLAGQKSGDWTYPILYAPELLKKEFSSDVADMKNSVKSRSNAQSSCAGHFIEDHLDSGFKGKWLHVDIAGPAFNGGRATGFGVAFLLQLLKDL